MPAILTDANVYYLLGSIFFALGTIINMVAR